MEPKERKAYRKLTKDQLIDNIDQLNKDCEYWFPREGDPVAYTPPPAKKAGVISIDFWPPSDWWRLHYHGWRSGQYAQLCIGPLRIDWFNN